MNNKTVNAIFNKKSFQNKFKISSVCFITWMTLGYILPSHASVIADINQGKMPVVRANVNGSITININSASAGGISHNKFTQFDVPQHGVILNNSSDISNTTLAESIKGNKNMANGAATLIINEVTSNRASQLNGQIEVAGKKADVIVANPSGITCNGCGFINTGRSTLTTGKLVINDDELTNINVNNGNITITGQGMHDQADYTSLLARTIKINASLEGNDLQAMSGINNNVIVRDNQLVNIGTAGTANSPSVGLDVSALGGMYANKITLVTNEAGIGISNAGLISAKTDLNISSKGAITNTGKMNTGDAWLISDAIDNSNGFISTAGDLNVNTTNTFNNTNGTIFSKNDININSSIMNNNSGSISADKINVTSGNVSNTESDKYVPSSSTPGVKTGGIYAVSDIIINSSNDIRSTLGRIQSDSGTVSLTAGNIIYGFSSEISGKDINIFSDIFYSGRHTGPFEEVNLSQTAKIFASNDLIIDAKHHYHNHGVLRAGNNIKIDSNGDIVNLNLILANKNISINSNNIYDDGFYNFRGFRNYRTINGSDITIRAKSVMNAKLANILADKNIIQTDQFDNDGYISSPLVINKY